MYRAKNAYQPSFEEGKFPLDEIIDKNDPICTIADQKIDWALVDKLYAQTFDNDTGAQAYPSRFAFGMLFLKEFLGCTDEAVVNQVKQNPCYQYFLGFIFYPKNNTCDS